VSKNDACLVTGHTYFSVLASSSMLDLLPGRQGSVAYDDDSIREDGLIDRQRTGCLHEFSLFLSTP
jgi:hypothetical protein